MEQRRKRLEKIQEIENRRLHNRDMSIAQIKARLRQLEEEQKENSGNNEENQQSAQNTQNAPEQQ